MIYTFNQLCHSFANVGAFAHLLAYPSSLAVLLAFQLLQACKEMLPHSTGHSTL